jgi:prepilin-type processing-associated H-X9-DG protein
VVAAVSIVDSSVRSDRWEPARRAQCVNNVKQIMLALANYEAAHGSYPSASISDRNGKPLLSWRVTILPLLGQEDLFRKFHLDEPWDSEHNRRLLDQMPSTYLCPAQAGWLKHQTIYQAAVGSETVWPPSRGIRLSEVTDGIAGTIGVLESDRPVPWTKPEDITFRSDRPFVPWEATHSAGINTGFLDGSVRFEKKTIREATLKALITRDGGERPSLDEY